MTFWFTVIFSLAVTLANCKTEAQTAPSSEQTTGTTLSSTPISTSATIFVPSTTTGTSSPPVLSSDRPQNESTANTTTNSITSFYSSSTNTTNSTKPSTSNATNFVTLSTTNITTAAIFSPTKPNFSTNSDGFLTTVVPPPATSPSPSIATTLSHIDLDNPIIPAVVTTEFPPPETTPSPSIDITLPPIDLDNRTTGPVVTTEVPPPDTTPSTSIDTNTTTFTLFATTHSHITHHVRTTPTTTITSTPTTTTTTTPPDIITTTPRPVLVCENGGVLFNGICICPDEWIGKICSDANFCDKQRIGPYEFPRTPIGLFAYSAQVCDHGTSNAGKPIASARCTIRTGLPRFEEPQKLDCGQTLTDIQQNLTSSANIEVLASSTQILTSSPQELTPENITTAAQIAETLLLSPNVTETVRVAAVATVSQLLSANETDDTEQNEATLRLTRTLDNLSVNLSLSLNSSATQVVQPNLVVQSAQIPAVNTQGVQFTSFSGTAGTFSANRTELNINTSSAVVDKGGIPEALIFVRFPKEEAAVERATPSNVSLGFVLYQNDRFFRSRRYKRQRATIRVLSGTVQGPLVPQHLEMIFRPQMINGTSLYEFACVFWNYELNDWSTDGCSKGNTSDGFLRCFCNHTTNFAALWSFRENYEYAKALDWISIIGLCFSIVGLVVTIVHHLEYNFRKFSGDSKGSIKARVVLLCIYITLLAFIITFLSGVRNPSRPYEISTIPNQETNTVLASEEHVEPDAGPCTAVTALLHFFLLASFLWNCVYGTQLVLLLRSLHSSLPPYWTTLGHAVGWGIPAIVMAITLAITYRVDDPLGYRQEEFCWLAALDKAKRFDYRKPMFWGFLLPVGLILLYNSVLLVLTSITTCKTNKDLQSTRHWSLRKKVLISFSVAVLLGLSWILGYLVLVTSGQSQLVFSIIFCICTTTQGFQIFILFTARTPSFKKNVSLSLQRLSEINNELHGRTYHLWRNIKSLSTFETYRDQYSKSLRR